MFLVYHVGVVRPRPKQIAPSAIVPIGKVHPVAVLVATAMYPSRRDVQFGVVLDDHRQHHSHLSGAERVWTETQFALAKGLPGRPARCTLQP